MYDFLKMVGGKLGGEEGWGLGWGWDWDWEIEVGRVGVRVRGGVDWSIAILIFKEEGDSWREEKIVKVDLGRRC